MVSKRLVVALLIFAAAFALGQRVRLDSDLSRLLPDTSPELRRAGELLRRALQRAVVDVEGGTEEAELLAERLGDLVRGHEDLFSLVDLLRDRAPRLIDDLDWVARQLDPARVRQTIRELVRRLLEPDGAYLAARAAKDPLGLTDLALKPLAAFTAGLKGARLIDGFLTSADGRHRLLLLDPGFSANDTARTEQFLKTLERASEGLEVRHLGTHRSTFDNARQMERDVRLTLIVGVALVALIALFVFRRPAVALLALTPAAFGAVVALGIYSLFGDAIAAAVAGFAAVLLGITIDYSVHVFYSARVPARAILMGATTTAAAFLALNASSLPGLREAGVFGALGIGAAALFAIFVLPGRARRKPVDLYPAVRLLQSRPVLVAALLATPLLLWGATKVRFEGNVRELSKLSAQAAADEEAITRIWGDAFRVTTLLVEGQDIQEALEKNDAVARNLEGYEHASLSGLLPSIKTQNLRLRRWRELWTPERIKDVRQILARAVEGTPLRKDAFEPFFLWVQSDPPPIEAADLPNSLVSDRLIETERGLLVSTPVFTREIEEFEGATVVNREAMVKKFARLVGGETLKLGLVGFGAVALLVSLWLGRLAAAIKVLLPLLLSCAWTFGLLGWLDIPITLASAIFVAFLFGLAVDYSIFLAHGRFERLRTGVDATHESDSAVLLCALTTCSGFGVLVLAGHPVLHGIGLTALLGIVSAAVATQVFTPVLIRPRPPQHSVAGLFRYQGLVVSHYAASKAKRDPIVAGLPALCENAREILVAGCGYGIVTARLALAKKRVRAIDVDARKVTTARNALRDFPDVEIVHGDLLEADLGRPDAATLIDVLHYWPKKTQREMLERIAAALETDGTLVFRDGCSDLPGHRFVAFWEGFSRRIGFTRAGEGFCFRTQEEWRNLMEECGLSVERTLPALGLSSNLVMVCRKCSG